MKVYSVEIVLSFHDGLFSSKAQVDEASVPAEIINE